MDQAGKNVVQLTSDATTSDEQVLYYTHVTWAPNGNQIAYVSYTGSNTQTMEAHLYVSDANGTNTNEVFASDRMIHKPMEIVAYFVYLYLMGRNQ
jgi:Tol biopolymer transport system component